MTKILPNSIIAATASSLYIWNLQDLQYTSTVDTSPKVIVTESPATCLCCSDEHIFIGFAGGMISMYDTDGLLLQTLVDPQVNPLTTPITLQLESRVKTILAHNDQVVALLSSGEIRRWSAHGASPGEVVVKKGGGAVCKVVLMKEGELCVISKKTSSNHVYNSDYVISFYNKRATEEYLAKVSHKWKRIGKEMKRFYHQIQNEQDPQPTPPTEPIETPPVVDASKIQLDKISSLCSKSLHVPICLILVTENSKLCIKSKIGLDKVDLPVPSLYHSLLILMEYAEIFNFEDTLESPLKGESWVLSPPQVRSLVGIPMTLHTTDMGCLCLMDTVPRRFTEEEINLLQAFAEAIKEVDYAHQKELSMSVELLTFSLRIPLGNAEKCLEHLREQFGQIEDDPYFKQLQYNIGISQSLVNEQLRDPFNSGYSNFLKSSVSKISIPSLFNDLKKSYNPSSPIQPTMASHSSSKSPSHFWVSNSDDENENTLDSSKGSSHRSRYLVETERESIKVGWNVSPNCVPCLWSYPSILLKFLMVLIGGALDICKNVEIWFLGANEKRGKLKKIKKISISLETSLKVGIFFPGVILDEEIKTLIFKKAFDFGVQGKRNHWLLYLFGIKFWSAEVSGSCEFEEMDNGLFVFSLIPSLGPKKQKTKITPKQDSPKQTFPTNTTPKEERSQNRKSAGPVL